MRKRRLVFAPVLIAIGGPLARLLDTGVRVLPQREWEERERLVHQCLRGASIQADGDGTLILPHLPGETLATVLENPELGEPTKRRAIELAVAALAALHRSGLTHGDAMAENVMVDLDAGAAHWFDFETIHEAARSPAWRRADDLRALLATCLVRTPRGKHPETARHIVDVYGEEGVTHLLASSFGAVLRRALPFHLGQAPLSLTDFRRIPRFPGLAVATIARDNEANHRQ